MDGLWRSDVDDDGLPTLSELGFYTDLDRSGHLLSDWKSCVGKLTVGSNPTLSATKSWGAALWLPGPVRPERPRLRKTQEEQSS
jgi:hypothetical protein